MPSILDNQKLPCSSDNQGGWHLRSVLGPQTEFLQLSNFTGAGYPQTFGLESVGFRLASSLFNYSKCFILFRGGFVRGR